MIKFIFGIIGMFIGSAVTVTVMSILAIAKNTEPPKEKPAKIWTKGTLCQWKGDTYVIYAMETDEQNQTVAILSNGHDAVIAPIEELEEVKE